MLYFYGPPFLRKEVKTLNRHNGQYNITFWKGREVRNFDQILLLLSAFYLINSHCTFSRGFCSPSSCTVSYCKYMQSNTLDLDIPRGRQVFNCRQQLISFCPLMMMIFKILTIQIQHRKSSDILLIPLFASNAGQLPPYLNPQSSSAKKRDNVPSQASQFPLTVSYNWYCLGRQKKERKWMMGGWRTAVSLTLPFSFREARWPRAHACRSIPWRLTPDIQPVLLFRISIALS